MKTYNYIIIGGGLAGGRTGDGIRKVDTTGSILLVTDEPHMPYQRPTLSKGYLTGKDSLDHAYLKEDSYYTENNIEVIQGVRASQVDPAAHKVSLEDERELGYDKLMLATGARARRLSFPGSDLPGVFTLRTIEDAQAIREVAQSGRKALVLGGSFIGSEVSASLAQCDLEVSIVFPESRILQRIVPEQMSAFVQAKYKGHGIRILSGTTVKQVEGNGKVQSALLKNGEKLEVDLIVMGTGVELNTALARRAGLEMAQDGAILVNKYLRTSEPDIYAAGDIAAWPDLTFGRRLRVEHWDVARRQGLRAGQNMAGQEKPYASLPYFFSDLFDLGLEVWGYLADWDQTVLRGSLEQGSFAFYYFQQGRMVGVLATSRPDEERKPMQALVKLRPTFAQVADNLRNETIALDSLTESISA
jgi:3-phenylpropionate/trans-cinnamate dioxygenase ferredoxin reductase subunit